MIDENRKYKNIISIVTLILNTFFIVIIFVPLFYYLRVSNPDMVGEPRIFIIVNILGTKSIWYIFFYLLFILFSVFSLSKYSEIIPLNKIMLIQLILLLISVFIFAFMMFYSLAFGNTGF